MELEVVDDEFEESEEDDLNIYNKKIREEALEDDEIADWEEGIMVGYDLEDALMEGYEDAVL